MAKLEKRFMDLSESEARAVIKSAVAIGVFQGGLLLSLLVALFGIALALATGGVR